MSYSILHPPSLQGTTEKLPFGYKIQFQGKNIPISDTWSTDPYFELFNKATGQLIYRSETYYADRSPKWEPFILPVSLCSYFDNTLILKIKDYDIYDEHDEVYKVEVTLRELTFKTASFGYIGVILCERVEKMPYNSEEFESYTFYFSAASVDRKDFLGLGKSDPFLVIKGYPLIQHMHPMNEDLKKKILEDKEKKVAQLLKDISLGKKELLTNVSKLLNEIKDLKQREWIRSDQELIIGVTEVKDKDLNPKWKPITLDSNLCGGMDSPITIQCFDFDDDGGHDIIGCVSTSLRKLLHSKEFDIINSSSKVKSSKYKNSGVLKLNDFEPSKIEKEIPIGFKFKFYGKSFDKKDLGINAKSDPFMIIRGKPYPFPSPDFFATNHTFDSIKDYKEIPVTSNVVIAKTEVQFKTLNPEWNEMTIMTEDCGGYDNFLRLEVYDYDEKGGYDIIGSCLTTLRNGLKAINPLYKGSGRLFVKDVQPIYKKDFKGYPISYTFTTIGKRLPMGDLRSSDPYLFIEATPYGLNEKKVIYKSEIHKKDLNPKFESFKLDVVSCGGYDREMIFNVKDYDTNGFSNQLGSFKTTLRELLMPNPVFKLSSGGQIEVVSWKEHLEKEEVGFSKEFPNRMGYLAQAKEVQDIFDVIEKEIKNQENGDTLNFKKIENLLFENQPKTSWFYSSPK